jgi:uncharacterized protein
MTHLRPFEWNSQSYYYSADHHRIFSSPKGLPHPGDQPDAPPQSVSIYNLYLNLSEGCNLRCEYCFTPAGSPGAAANMPREVAQTSIVRLARWWHEHPSTRVANITFFGGEPLLNREVLRHTVYFADEWSRAYGVPFSYSISTNGTLVTDDDLKFFRDNRIFVWFSIDGPPEIHDRHRPFRKGGQSSHDLAIRNAAAALRTMPEYRVGVRATLSSGYGKLSRVVDYLATQGFRIVSTSGAEPNHKDRRFLSPEDFGAFDQDLDESASILLHWRSRGLRSFPLDQDLASLEKGPAGRFICDAGRGSLTVDPNGQLYPCHRFVGDSRFMLGDVHGEFDLTLCEEFAKLEYSKIQGCRTCWARKFCLGCCAGASIAAGLPLGHPYVQHCEARKRYALISLKCAADLRIGIEK